MAFRKVRSLSRVTALGVGLFISISACSDSTGPGELDPNGALQSLALGIGAIGGVEPRGAVRVYSIFGGSDPIIDQVDVTIDGTSRRMFALGLRETFPAGTCIENLFIDPYFPPEPGECTPPPLGLALILWQSRSAFAPPDRLLFIAADVGTSNFAFDFFSIPAPGDVLPAFAMYVEGEDRFWMSVSGTLTSLVTATSESCGIALPPYAKSGSCSVARFDEEGAIAFEEMLPTMPIPNPNPRLNVTIPRQTVRGLWQTITETQPFTLPGFQRTSSRWLGH